MKPGRIETAFAAARRPVFIPYVTAGDPTADTTLAICLVLAEEGAGVIELGVPFSDPVADGPVIQRACERALKEGMTLSRALDLAMRVRAESGVALVLFTYVNPILRMGIELFALRAAASGIDGVLATDLPFEESGPLRAALDAHEIRTITLLAPTSGAPRIALLPKSSGGFVYYISRTGVTGEKAALAPGLADEVAALRKATSLPVAVGFGISTAEQYSRVAEIADGVVVGSAIVRAIEEGKSDPVGAARAAARRIAGRGQGFG
ncbi:MAG TPA: tryptophan synthase subunit alpha [Verrucomicrobiae bacterium]|nr:tryptophan synthase subunit alpha [Verrucomicrobiae bacterium]